VVGGFGVGGLPKLACFAGAGGEEQ